ncbi:MAG: hypothetical protein QNK17_08285, partial [Hyphomicrobiaceae bacterium]|nr:hypothetical protein [Hyphomicrobiaceae bacterium]MDX2450408.1 hypothetical protein [Hyphomicrobiaceae bacterium]
PYIISPSMFSDCLLALIPGVDRKRDEDCNDDAGTDDSHDAPQSYGFTFHIAFLDRLRVCVWVR